ncbi:hypothetical protein AVEN_77446-1 [Araneus ventricosus]|uniref:Uncharacterized protein n=1 Tax=Araneus ventricosus TaxID=182803 RepID=A0A4Y2JMI6_ARAVE|nr:hypothetical protein AVEN_77446-1 [Araneus ventricosus]
MKCPTSPLQSEGRLDYTPYVYSLLHWSQICTIVHSHVFFIHLNREEKPYDKSDHVYGNTMDMFQVVPLFQPPYMQSLMQHYILELAVDSFLLPVNWCRVIA